MHGQGRRDVEDVGVAGLSKVRDALLRAQKRAATVDLVHEVVALHGRVDGLGQ